MEIQNIKIADLKPYHKNAKKHPQAQIENIANSIKEFGFLQPVVVDKDNNLIVGHGRVEAAKLLGLEEVPTVSASNLTKEQVKAYRLADNKLNESEWDMALVLEELKDLPDSLLSLSGFTLNPLNNLETVSSIKDEWRGMPEFLHEDQTAYRQILVSFNSDEDVNEFGKLIGQKLSNKTRAIWFPPAEIETRADKRY